MKYIVMECHPAYAVVLDEHGEFSKVANMRYEVGQTVSDVVAVALPQPAPAKKTLRWATSLVAAAACVALLVGTVFVNQKTYASVYLSINPEVRIDVNRRDKVVGLQGINADGTALLEGYSYQRKDLDLVMDELMDLAIEKNFLHEGATVNIELDAKDNTWVESHSNALDDQLSNYLAEKITVNVEVTDKCIHSDHRHDHDDDDDDDDWDDDDLDDDDLDDDDLDDDDWDDDWDDDDLDDDDTDDEDDIDDDDDDDDDDDPDYDPDDDDDDEDDDEDEDDFDEDDDEDDDEDEDD